MIRRRDTAPDTPASALRPENQAALVRLLAAALVADVRGIAEVPDASGTSPSGHARNEPQAVVGRLHPLLAAASSS